MTTDQRRLVWGVLLIFLGTVGAAVEHYCVVRAGVVDLQSDAIGEASHWLLFVLPMNVSLAAVVLGIMLARKGLARRKWVYLLSSVGVFLVIPDIVLSLAGYDSLSFGLYVIIPLMRIVVFGVEVLWAVSSAVLFACALGIGITGVLLALSVGMAALMLVLGVASAVALLVLVAPFWVVFGLLALPARGLVVVHRHPCGACGGWGVQLRVIRFLPLLMPCLHCYRTGVDAAGRRANEGQ